VSRPFGSGIARVVAWLLTPVVAWAASFVGGWIGAATAGGDAGIAPLVIGGIAGGALGVLGWLGLLFWSGRSTPDADQGVIES